MSDHDRGAYTPPTTDAPLSFDARQPVRGARPIPFTLIISALVLVALVVAIVLFYRSGVREAGQPPQTVGAPIASMKEAAPAEAQPQDPAAGLQIYRSENGELAEAMPAQPQFTAPPEQPQPRPQPPQVVVAPAAAPTTPVNGTALRPALPAGQAQAPAQTQVAQAAPPPAPKAAPAPAPKAAAPVAPKPAAVAAGGAVVQIGAVSSTALADKAWNEAVATAPGLAAGKGKSVEKVDRDGGVLYRTAVTGFASKADAAAFCAKLKAAGKSCFVR